MFNEFAISCKHELHFVPYLKYMFNRIEARECR